MSTAELRVIYRPDDDGTGEIIATVRSGAFSAQGSAWFGRDLEIFLAGLRSYPLSSENPPMIEGGFWKSGKSGVLDQCHLRITVKPCNTRGALLVRAELASQVQRSPDADLQNSATIRFLTEYAAINHFAAEFELLLNGQLDVAILHGMAS
jgi:hypothetical protein